MLMANDTPTGLHFSTPEMLFLQKKDKKPVHSIECGNIQGIHCMQC